MRKATIVVGGAGGAPSEGVIFSLQVSGEFEVFGFGSDPTDVHCSSASKKFIVPQADSPGYKEALLSKLSISRPDLVHFQNDLEILTASRFRDEIEALGIRTFMPEHSEIEICTDKWLSYQKFAEAGLVVPRNSLISSEADLARAFRELAKDDGRIWIRDSSVGGGGKGSLSTDSPELASAWISRAGGWGTYLAAEHLGQDTMTWQSIWHNGELIAAQARERFGWVHSSRSVSGVTGVTKVGRTTSRSDLTELGIQAVKAISTRPHGIYGVDFTLDSDGLPNPTEINISRFFTTIRFFTEAGFNMPEIFASLALGKDLRYDVGTINPLPEGLLWLRGMDREPRLVPEAELNTCFS